MAAGNYADACPAYEQAFRLDPTVNGAFNLAECHEALGRTATAYLDWLEAARLAKGKNKPDKLAKATERGKQLFVKLSTIEVKLQTATVADSSVVVLVDDEPVDAAWLVTAHAIDPGTHFVEVRAAGKVTWRTKVLVAPEADRQVVSVPVLVAEPKAHPRCRPRRRRSPPRPRSPSSRRRSVTIGVTRRSFRALSLSEWASSRSASAATWP
jgi:hypothetical protein